MGDGSGKAMANTELRRSRNIIRIPLLVRIPRPSCPQTRSLLFEARGPASSQRRGLEKDVYEDGSIGHFQSLERVEFLDEWNGLMLGKTDQAVHYQHDRALAMHTFALDFHYQ